MCFVHSDHHVHGRQLIQQIPVDGSVARAIGEVAPRMEAYASGSGGGMPVAGSGTPDASVQPPTSQSGMPQASPQAAHPVVDGFSRVLHNRWNQDLPAAVRVRQGDVIQLLCRDALDIGLIHPLTGPVEVEGAEPGDILEVEVLDVAPLVDFGYVVITPVLGLF